MADDPNWDDIFASQPPTEPKSDDGRPAPVAAAAAPTSRRETREQEKSPRRSERRASGGGEGRGPRRSRKGGVVLLVIALVVVGGGTAGVVAAWGAVAPIVAKLSGNDAPEDYPGTGNGTEVTFAVTSGENGSDIATNLFDDGITASFESVYSLLVADTTLTFQPGTYTLQQEMSASSAVAALQDSANRVTDKLVIPEGTPALDVYSLISSATEIPEADVQAAASDVASFGLPAEATSLEGWLFPATYELDPGLDAHGYLQLLVDTM